MSSSLIDDYRLIQEIISLKLPAASFSTRIEWIAIALGLSEAELLASLNRWSWGKAEPCLFHLCRAQFKGCLAQAPIACRHRQRLRLLPYEAVASTLSLPLKAHYGVVPSLFGHCLIAVMAGYVIAVAFVDEPALALEDHLQQLQSEWPTVVFVEDARLAAEWGQKIFSAQPVDEQTLSALVRVREFRRHVWETLVALPAGGLYAYRSLALAMGQGKSTRAVATALAKNPLAYLIPCHRVMIVKKPGTVRMRKNKAM